MASRSNNHKPFPTKKAVKKAVPQTQKKAKNKGMKAGSHRTN
jgi:hypothetical protein